MQKNLSTPKSTDTAAAWVYLNDSQTPPTKHQDDFNVLFDFYGWDQGNYIIYFFKENSYDWYDFKMNVFVQEIDKNLGHKLFYLTKYYKNNIKLIDIQ